MWPVDVIASLREFGRARDDDDKGYVSVGDAVDGDVERLSATAVLQIGITEVPIQPPFLTTMRGAGGACWHRVCVCK